MSTTVQQKPVLDKYGNIRLHALEGLDMPIKRRNSEGNFVDISTSSFRFLIEGVGEWNAVDGNDVYELRIQITPTEMEDMQLLTDYKYALVDDSGDVPMTVLEGKIKLEGFRA